MAIERGRGSRHSQQSHYYLAKPFEEKVKDCCRSTIAFVFSNVGVCGLMVGYTIMGGFLFCFIEGSEDKAANVTITMEDVRARTIEELWNITVSYNVLDHGSWNTSVSQVLSKYQTTILEKVDEGWDGANVTTLKANWDFDGAFLYSLTVITTIGYGHITPVTEVGKIMTILYTIFGMPVFLLYMANMGDILAKSLKWTYSKLCICRQPEPRFDASVVWRSAEATLRAPGGPSGSFNQHHGHRHGRSEGDDVYTPELSDEISMDTATWSGEQPKIDVSSVNIPITVSLVIMVLLLYGGTLLFQKYDAWDPLTSFYFCFISLTTIGFGDFVPGFSAQETSADEKRTSLYICSLYLMFGLALLSMCFNLMQEEVVHKITACLNAIRFIKRREGD